MFCNYLQIIVVNQRNDENEQLVSVIILIEVRIFYYA